MSKDMAYDFNMTSRVLYQDLRDSANDMALAASNESWRAAFERLRDASDGLDAMFARSNVNPYTGEDVAPLNANDGNFSGS